VLDPGLLRWGESHERCRLIRRRKAAVPRRRANTPPQIIAAAIGGLLLQLVGPEQSHMMIVAGIALVLGAISVGVIKEHKASE